MCNDYEQHVRWAEYREIMQALQLAIPSHQSELDLPQANDIRINDTGPVMRAAGDEIELVPMTFGLPPGRPGGRLTLQITEHLPSWSMAPVATAIQAMRGVALINAVTIVAEVGDFFPVRQSAERCNGAWRYEFYAVYELPSSVDKINPILDGFQHLYNHHRPHGALCGLAFAQYLPTLQAQDAPPSQRC